MSWREKFSIPSRLDSYLQYLTGELYSYGENRPEYTDELFVRQLLKLEPPTVKMQAGTIVHSYFEKFTTYNLSADAIQMDGWTINCSIPLTISWPECREISINSEVGGTPIHGKVDAITATRVHDLKCTGKFNAEQYMESMQWKTYLAMTRLNEFIYDVLIVNIDEFSKTIFINGYEQLKLYRYDFLDHEVANCLKEYWELLDRLKPLIIKTAQENNIEIKGL